MLPSCLASLSDAESQNEADGTLHSGQSNEGNPQVYGNAEGASVIGLSGSGPSLFDLKRSTALLACRQ